MTIRLTAPELTLRRWLMSLWLPLMLLLLGYGIATVYVSSQEQAHQQRIQQALADRLNQIAEGVREKVTLYQYGLRGTRGAVMSLSPQQFDYDDMQTYTSVRDYKLEFPGARGFGLIIRVEPDQKADFLNRMARERPDYAFQIKQLSPHEDTLFVITYIEPEQDNRQAVGLDIGSEQMRRKAALDAALNNDVRLTAPITLVQADKQTQQGFLILMPVYSTPGVPKTAEQRLQALYGWSYAPLLINEVLSTVSGLQNDVLLSIADVTDESTLEFFRRGETERFEAEQQQQQNLSLFGRNWQLTLVPTPQFIAALNLSSTRTSFLQVMGLTALLALAVYLLQVLIMRRTLLAQHKQELAHIAEQTLLKANADLEQQIAERTAEISQVSALQRSILSSAGYAIIATDENGIITAFNPAAEQLLGYRAKDVLFSKTPEAFHLKEEVERYARKLSSDLGYPVKVGFDAFVAKAKLGVQDNNRWTYVTKTGKHVQVKLNVSALTNEQGVLVGFLGIAFDLTEQLKYEAELAQAREQAESANKAKSNFLANMSHEIRTPMNGILGLLQLVANTPLDKRQADYIDKTRRAASSLLTLLNDILDFSKVEAGKLELDPHPFNLPLLLQDISLILSTGSEHKELEVLYDVAADVPVNLIGDGFRIKQVLLNLAGNAIKFTEKGEVVISIRVTQLSEEQVRLHCSIKDTGIGMTTEQQKAIFAGFHQAESSISRRFGGTGLGLAISKRLVNLMGGDISVQSELGRGSTFSFELLLQLPDADNSNAAENHAVDITALKVLIVDDNDSARIILRDIADSLGWQAQTAANAEQASLLLQQVEHSDRGYDVVFVDWRMPGMDGLELARHIRETKLSKAPMIVMISAFGKEVLSKHVEDYEHYLDGFLAKPVTQNMMLNAVKAILISENASQPQHTHCTNDKPLAGLSLLLVEDNLTNQLVASELLQQQGAKVYIAGSGNEALASLEHQTAEFDLVLMDLQMPDMDGFETTRLIRQQPQFQHLPIVAMTANALPSDKAACLDVGMQDHIAKPFSLNEVVEKIRRYCHVSRTASEIPQVDASNGFDITVLNYCRQHQIALQDACNRLGGSNALYFRVLSQFSKDLAHSQQQLAGQRLSCYDARLIFHSLKSAAGTVGFNRLAGLAAQMESQLSLQNSDNYEVDANILQAMQRAEDEARSLITLLQPELTSSEQTTRIASANNAAQITTLRQYLSNGNMAALACYQQLAGALKAKSPELNAKLDIAIKMLAFDEATAILDELLVKNE
ncbi:response regulator [Rheinheimera sp. FR7-31]|uniref:PAS domain-containing hybrid sensor histidine kinase/response regulator n=1 Tax=Rheinheimera fenheensis TaxID=3152295 RepID=UPI00325D34FE